LSHQNIKRVSKFVLFLPVNNEPQSCIWPCDLPGDTFYLKYRHISATRPVLCLNMKWCNINMTLHYTPHSDNSRIGQEWIRHVPGEVGYFRSNSSLWRHWWFFLVIRLLRNRRSLRG